MSLRRRALLKQARLPNEYQEVEWIGTDGYSYIQFPQEFNANAVFEFSVMDTSETTTESAFIGDNTFSTFEIYFLNNTINTYGAAGLIYPSNGSSVSKNTVINIKATTVRLVKNIKYGLYRQGRYPFVGRLYSLNIAYGSNTLVSVVPCYRKVDSEIGFYDIVNNIFYTNQGTGEFTVGPDVN